VKTHYKSTHHELKTKKGGTHQDDLRHAEGVVAQRLVERLLFIGA
jgi:hypothetical protein